MFLISEDLLLVRFSDIFSLESDICRETAIKDLLKRGNRKNRYSILITHTMPVMKPIKCLIETISKDNNIRNL